MAQDHNAAQQGSPKLCAEVLAFLALVRRDGVLLEYNAYWSERLGWSPDELTEHTLDTLHTPQSAARLRAVLARGEAMAHVEATLCTCDETPVEVRWALRRVDAQTWSLCGVTQPSRQPSPGGMTAHEWTRLAAESDEVLHTVITPEGVILHETPALTRSLGLRPGETRGQTLFPRVHPADLETLTTLLHMTGHNTTSAPALVRLRHEDGSWRMFALSARANRRDGALHSLVLTAQDVHDAHAETTRQRIQIAELERAVRVLRNEHPQLSPGRAERLLGVLQFAPHGDTYRLCDANQTGLTWLPLLAEPPHDGEPWHLGLFAQDVRHTSLRAVRRERLCSLLVPAPPEIQPGGVLEIIAIDTPPDLLTLAVYLRPIDRAADTGAQLAELVNGATRQPLSWEVLGHELRTPLHAVLGFNRMLREELEDGSLTRDGMRDDLDRMHRSAERLMTMLDDLLMLLRLDAESVQVNMEHIVLSELLEGVRRACVSGHSSGSVFRRLHIETEALEGMYTDRDKLTRAITNIIQHAMTFSASGHALLSVMPAMGRSMPGVEFALELESFDPPPDILELLRVYTPHPRGAAVTPGELPGHHSAAIGLEVARQLVDLLGGRFDVALLEHGAHISVFIPSPTELPLPGLMALHTPPQHITGPLPAISPLRQEERTILLIDDDEELHELARRFLRKTSWRLVGATDGQQGIRRALRLRPDLILLDIILPLKDGWTVLAELRQHPELAQTPIIVQSVVDDRELMASLGATSFVKKPMTRESLLDVVLRHGGAP